MPAWPLSTGKFKDSPALLGKMLNVANGRLASHTHTHTQTHHLTNVTFACLFLGLTVWLAVRQLTPDCFSSCFSRFITFSLLLSCTHFRALPLRQAEVPKLKSDKEAFLHLPAPLCPPSALPGVLRLCVCLYQTAAKGKREDEEADEGPAFCSLCCFCSWR